MWFNPSTWTVVDDLQGQNKPVSGFSPQASNGGGGGGGGGGGVTMPTSSTNYNPGNAVQPGGYAPDNTSINNAPASNAPSSYWVGGKNYGSADNYANTQKNEVNMMLDDQTGTLNKLLGSVGTQKTQGIQKLADSYNTEKLAGENQYGQQFEDNTRQKMGALGKVDTNARTAANSLRRLLGLSGSANQSALKFAAPNAIARVASQERGDQIENSGIITTIVLDSFSCNIL